MFRVVVQDSRVTPTSGKVVAQLGHYDPHTKAVTIDKEKASLFLTNGAQPSDRVARLLQKEGVKLPDWVTLKDSDRSRTIRNADKLRKNQPKDELSEEKAEGPTTDAPADESPATDAPAGNDANSPADGASEENSEDVAKATDEEPKEEEKKEAQVAV